VKDSFIVGTAIFASDKKCGLKSWNALEFKKWGGVEPSSLTEVYAYVLMGMQMKLLCLPLLFYLSNSIRIYWCTTFTGIARIFDWSVLPYTAIVFQN